MYVCTRYRQKPSTHSLLSTWFWMTHYPGPLCRVFHSKTIILRWLKMTLKYIVHIKERYFYNHKDPPFDMKHQLTSADSLPVVKFDLSRKTFFHKFFLWLLQSKWFVCKTLFSIGFNLKIQYSKLYDMCGRHFEICRVNFDDL